MKFEAEGRLKGHTPPLLACQWSPVCLLSSSAKAMVSWFTAVSGQSAAGQQLLLLDWLALAIALTSSAPPPEEASCCLSLALL